MIQETHRIMQPSEHKSIDARSNGKTTAIWIIMQNWVDTAILQTCTAASQCIFFPTLSISISISLPLPCIESKGLISTGCVRLLVSHINNESGIQSNEPEIVNRAQLRTQLLHLVQHRVIDSLLTL